MTRVVCRWNRCHSKDWVKYIFNTEIDRPHYICSNRPHPIKSVKSVRVLTDAVPRGLQGVMRPWFDFWFWGCIYCLHVIITNPLPYSSFRLRIDPLGFQAGCSKRQLNLALVFSCSFCVVVHFFDWRMCAFVVWRLVFSMPSQEIRLRNYLLRVECDVKPQLSQSINQSIWLTDVEELADVVDGLARLGDVVLVADHHHLVAWKHAQPVRHERVVHPDAQTHLHA